ncbi:Flp pilus assembly protein TadD [Azospirillum lipoferum]|uniref:Tetratricopeptide repeat protein n=1 Tax=Azospirillum lipoferum TaxID=193 RepID=A0A5A9GFF5_AZOLI|nr:MULTISPECIES: tetratricopeptide repeat protein [Azospirillum]KAA0592545.1 tetratricopeptide repeat protein [Azospirillum lipoferum]MCP1614466.1 Flp pilus assembly protein TadD [Azospirillum lipoferum]MDW5532702.1 tetratricopeptide repeat protein [Azospirillum sp. NL1]
MSATSVLLAEAFDRHQTGGFEEAERLYRRILAGEPAEAEALHRHGLLVAQLGRLEEADRLLTRSLTLEPAAAEVAVNHARILRALQRPQDGARRFRHALALTPALSTALEGLGHAEREGGDSSAAAGAYGRAALLGAGAAVLHQWGIALDGIGRLEEAAEVLRRSAHLDPMVPSVAAKLAAILHRLGRNGEAAAWYRHALVLQPGRSELREAFSDIAVTRSDLPPAA